MANPSTAVAGYSTLSVDGFDLAATYTGYAQGSAVSSTNTPEYPSATGQFFLGQVTKGTDSSEWVYVLAGSAISLGDMVVITNTGALWTANSITNILATGKLGSWIGVAPLIAIPSGQYGWVQRQGKCAGMSVIFSTAANTQLFTTTTAGRLTSASVAGSTVTISGAVLTTAAPTTSGPVQAMLNFPVLGVNS